MSETIDELDSASLRDLYAFVRGLGRSLALAGAAVSETHERLTDRGALPRHAATPTSAGVVVVTEDGGRRLNNTSHEMRVVS